jgi:ribosome-interacting GTPase 1
MPANLTPDYLAAEARFREAVTTEEKLAALDEMYATIPKHKGTEKLRADIKRRISKLRERDKQAGKKGKRFDEFHVEKQGAGQIVLLGPPNAGRSTLLSRLTLAEPEVGDYPYTTRVPMPGMMEFEDVLVQLVDTPPIDGEHTEGGLISLARGADAVAIVLDASDNELLDEIEEIRQETAKSRTVLVGLGSHEADSGAGAVTRSTLVIANKIDLPGASDNFDVLEEVYGSEFGIYPISALTGEGLERLRQALFDLLGIIRVYTKVPGKPPDRDRPFTIKKGSTLMDFAADVHKDFVRHLRFARAWGRHHLDGAQIGRDHVLEDGDVVELHE